MLFALCTLIFLGAGCGYVNNFTSSIGRLFRPGESEIKIIPLSSQDVADLPARDLIEVMRKAGFSDEQILIYGPDLRNSLMYSGGARVRLGKKVEAEFVVIRECVFITTRLRGSFIYDIKQGWVNVGPSTR